MEAKEFENHMKTNMLGGMGNIGGNIAGMIKIVRELSSHPDLSVEQKKQIDEVVAKQNFDKIEADVKEAQEKLNKAMNGINSKK